MNPLIKLSKSLELIGYLQPSNQARRLAEKYGYLPYMIERYIYMFGQEVHELLEANESPLPTTFRCNDFLISCTDLAKRLEEKGFIVEPLRLAPHGYVVLREPISIGATHEYLQGYYYVQGPASMLPVYELEPKPGELILDMAAAPGGKATQILQLSRDKAKLVAVDISRTRLRALRSHLSRMGFKSYIIIRHDSRMLDLRSVFDKVLLDAPSTGEGIIRKDQSRKKSRSFEDVKAVSLLQAQLLEAALNYARRGGVVVYAACTLAVEEGEAVVDAILSTRDDVKVEPLKIPHVKALDEFYKVKFNSEIRKCGRLLPHIHGTEGFFVCKLRKL